MMPFLRMTPFMRVAATAGLLTLALNGPTRAADACDALTATMIRATGASLAGRAGAGAVFRAADAERMSLDCRAPRRMVFGSREREPQPPFFTLIGRAAQALTGASAQAVEVLALHLHQDSLLTGVPRQGVAGRAALRCATGPRADALARSLTVCALVPNRPPRRGDGLFAGRAPG